MITSYCSRCKAELRGISMRSAVANDVICGVNNRDRYYMAMERDRRERELYTSITRWVTGLGLAFIALLVALYFWGPR